MKSIKLGALIGILALLAFAVAAGGAGAQGPTPVSPPMGGTEGGAGDTPGDWVAAAISYQGRLTHPTTGAPLSGTYDLEFTFWSLSSEGIQFGATILKDDQVINNGLYSTTLAVDPGNFCGQELWLQIRVKPGTGGTWETLTPRVQVLPTAYALSLRPGARIQGSVAVPNAIVMATNTSSGWGLRGESTELSGYGVYGYNGSTSTSAYGGGVFGTTLASGYGVRGEAYNGYGVFGYTHDGYAVYGLDAGSTTARGYGGYFVSSNGVGVYGYSGATPMWNNAYAPGVYGRSANGVGVYGVGAQEGVYGYSPSRSGVYGETGNDDPAVAAGVWGAKRTGGGDAMRGSKYGGIGRAIYGTNGGSTGSGVAGESTNYIGLWGETGRADNNYGLYTPDNLWSLNYHLMGAVMQVVQNGGREALEPGDVAVFSGLAAPLDKNGPPVIQVAKADVANSTAVAGVVYSRFNIQVVTNGRSDGQGFETGLEITPAGPVPPGEYLLLVVQGPAQVKASALTGAIQPGDLLSSAGTAGHAARAATVTIEGGKTAVPGTVFGKALEPLGEGQKLIYVFVTLQ